MPCCPQPLAAADIRLFMSFPWLLLSALDMLMSENIHLGKQMELAQKALEARIPKVTTTYSKNLVDIQSACMAMVGVNVIVTMHSTRLNITPAKTLGLRINSKSL